MIASPSSHLGEDFRSRGGRRISWAIFKTFFLLSAFAILCSLVFISVLLCFSLPSVLLIILLLQILWNCSYLKEYVILLAFLPFWAVF